MAQENQRSPDTSDAELTRRLRALVDSSSDAILTVGCDQDITSWNPAAIRLFGYQAAEVLGKPVSCLLFPGQAREFETFVRRALQREPVDHFEAVFRRRQGTPIQVSIGLSPLCDAMGDAVGCAMIARDITERKKSESLVALQHRRLMQADKLASLGVLIAGIAHEINNPNNYILLNARMLAKVWHDVLPILQAHYETNGDFTLAGIPFTHVHDKIGQLVSGTADGAMRIQRIVHNLRNFVRNDTGDLNQPVDMNQVVAAALVIVDSLISNSTNVFSVEYAPLLPTVKGNAQQLEQVIINLVTNSCQALRNKQEAIHVVTRHDLPSNSVVVQVADGGVGIPPEHTAHIFDLFFTTKQEREGTGLGLPVSHSIITNHGGDVRIESELGKGTTVTISLPLHRRDNLA